MVISGVIFLLVAFIIGVLIIWLIRSEMEDPDVNEKLSRYGFSELFQKHYEENAYKKASTVIKGFEKKFPEEIKRLAASKKYQETLFNNADRYNYLIAKYEKDLRKLRANGSKYFSKKELNSILDVTSINELVQAHIINFYNDMYLLHDQYVAEHPFELNEDGKLRKIEI